MTSQHFYSGECRHRVEHLIYVIMQVNDITGLSNGMTILYRWMRSWGWALVLRHCAGEWHHRLSNGMTVLYRWMTSWVWALDLRHYAGEWHHRLSNGMTILYRWMTSWGWALVLRQYAGEWRLGVEQLYDDIIEWRWRRGKIAWRHLIRASFKVSRGPPISLSSLAGWAII